MLSCLQCHQQQSCGKKNSFTVGGGMSNGIVKEKIVTLLEQTSPKRWKTMDRIDYAVRPNPLWHSNITLQHCDSKEIIMVCQNKLHTFTLHKYLSTPAGQSLFKYSLISDVIFFIILCQTTPPGQQPHIASANTAKKL